MLDKLEYKIRQPIGEIKPTFTEKRKRERERGGGGRKFLANPEPIKIQDPYFYFVSRI